ncbi:MAG TPA: RHS repeat-associated core domain-containing protein, partial [Thermoanaerobaculia bacterium]|nr:RHS repeat-associated core domain-containing protein [Thermoanaerobaculia bacterium]
AFALGGQTITGTTDAQGIATVSLTPTGTPSATPLTVTFAGAGPYTGSSASLLFALRRDETALVYTGKPVVADGLSQPVSARLTDPDGGAPLAGKTITFTLGTVTVSATTGADGVAATTISLPASQPTGQAVIQIAFAGDTYEQPAFTTAPVLIYQPSSFVIWGGNIPGLQVGQRINFWGSQWEQQVTGGDYNAHNSFKGYGTVPSSSIGLCEPTATTTGTPRLDPSCWTSKTGNSNPPATVADFIQVIVATSADLSGSTVYGNIAATVVVQVDRTLPYAPDPGHPGFGTIVAVIDDGASLFPPSRTAATTAKAAASAPVQDLTTKSIAAGTRQFFLYTPEMNLLAETDLTTAQHPAIANEYIWFNGHPVAQIDSTGTTAWTFTDHLGTPILQTSAPQGIVWRAEYEPFGEVYTLRSYDRHQPLRLPGQEAEELGSGANGVTDRSYNIHRWYRGEWGRYTQADPIGLGDLNVFGYAANNPLGYSDPEGLFNINNIIKQLPTSDPGASCGSPFACSLVTATAYCDCHCDDAVGAIVADATLLLTGRIYYFNGPFGKIHKTTVDPTVKDKATAIAHEYNYHINVAIDAVTPLLKNLEAMRFNSVEECRGKCSEVAKEVNSLFAATLHKTQADENAKK